MTGAPHPPWQLEPAPRRARLWLMVLGLLLPLGLIGTAMAMALAEQSAQGAGSGNILPITAGVGLLIVGVWWAIDRLLHRHRLAMDAQAGLEITTTLYRRRLAWDELDLDRAGVLDLAERPEHRPLLKTNGVSLPGLQSGWFRTRSGDKAFVARAGGMRIVRVPTTRGFELVLQARQPRALLEALHEFAGRRPAR